MSNLDLTPSLCKIDRAERKLSNAVKILNEWISRGVEYTIRREQHGQRVHVIARFEELPPEDIAWEVVEAVGHLRSALDKMLVAIVESNGRGVSGVGFPFGGSSRNGQTETFPTERMRSALEKKLTAEQWEAVLAERPYPGGNDLLWAVNELANEDKHRKDLVRVLPAIASRTISIRFGMAIGGLGVGPDKDFVLPDKERETLLMSYNVGPGSVHPQIDENLTLNVVFGPVEPVSGKSVFTTLERQIRLVKGIVEKFRAAFG